MHWTNLARVTALATCSFLACACCRHNGRTAGPYNPLTDAALHAGQAKRANKPELLLKASASGDLRQVEDLVGAGVNVNFQASEGSRFTPLLWAVFEKNYDVALFLLKHGADPDIPDASGMKAVDFVSPQDNSPEARQVIRLLERDPTSGP